MYNIIIVKWRSDDDDYHNRDSYYYHYIRRTNIVISITGSALKNIFKWYRRLPPRHRYDSRWDNIGPRSRPRGCRRADSRRLSPRGALYRGIPWDLHRGTRPCCCHRLLWCWKIWTNKILIFECLKGWFFRAKIF